MLGRMSGDIHGIDAVERLRLLDVTYPEAVTGGFAGPGTGGERLRERTGAVDRPVTATVVGPATGRGPDEHAQAAFDAWMGGLDMVVDDVHLADMAFDGFDDRMHATFGARDEAEDRTDRRAVYVPNITAPVAEMKRRADLVADLDGCHVLVDVLAAGWSAVQEMRAYLDGRDVALHGHLSGHAAVSRVPDHGVALPVIATWARLAGVDTLRAAPVGDGPWRGLVDALRGDLHGVERVMPVVPGLDPGTVPDMVDRLGSGIVVQAGSGVHGHPDGTRAGAVAFRAAVDAAADGTPLDEAAADSPELAAALDAAGTED